MVSRSCFHGFPGFRFSEQLDVFLFGMKVGFTVFTSSLFIWRFQKKKKQKKSSSRNYNSIAKGPDATQAQQVSLWAEAEQVSVGTNSPLRFAFYLCLIWFKSTYAFIVLQLNL